MSENNHKKEAKAGTDTSTDLKAQLNELSSVKKVIGIVSGKGGVGKSLVTSMLAILMQRKGYRVAILDADVTGPSIPKAFGINERAEVSEHGFLPAKSRTGIEIISTNMFLESETDPVVWRGPILSNTVKQFWTDVIWQDIDYMFVDLPPGTGDVPLTVFQSLAVDGLIIVTSPQELVSMIVAKAIKMAGIMDLPVLGIIENMAYFQCPGCDQKYHIFGESHLEEIGESEGLQILGKLPLVPEIAALVDQGEIESFQGSWLDSTAHMLGQLINTEIEQTIKIAIASDQGQVATHFGYCEHFIIYTIKNQKIVAEEKVASPGHKPGFLPNFLSDLGVNIIFSGGMGSGAIDIFREKNIQVVTGAQGKVEDVVENYLADNLDLGGNICDHHD